MSSNFYKYDLNPLYIKILLKNLHKRKKEEKNILNIFIVNEIQS